MAAAPRPLPPATRRFVGWLLVLAGVLLALGLLLQIGIVVYVSEKSGFAAVGWSRLGTLALGLAAAAVLVYYGRLLRQPQRLH